jgi:hypothetical protein
MPFEVIFFKGKLVREVFINELLHIQNINASIDISGLKILFFLKATYRIIIIEFNCTISIKALHGLQQ